MNRFETLTVNSDDHVAIVEMSRPEKTNSINQVMWRELRQAFNELDQAPDVHVVVLQGAGKHFSTGIDLAFLAGIQTELNQMSQGLRQECLFHLIADLQTSVSAVETCRKSAIRRHEKCRHAALRRSGRGCQSCG